jgi:hypothetical protein
MSNSSNHGGLKAFEPTLQMNEKGFIYKTWDDRIYPPFYDPEAIAQLQQSWDTDEHDMFICTHQKVGTHLTKKFVSEVLRSSVNYPATNGISSGDIGHGTIAWPEVMISQHGMDHFKQHIENTKGYPRVWYTHCSMHDLPFRSAHPKTRFIHVFRDPRGAFVSQYYFYRSHPMLGVSEDLTMDEFARMFTEGNMYFGDYHTHTLDWISGCEGKIDKENLLVLKYEDLVERKMESARILCQFLLSENLPTDAQLEEIVAATEFNTMKKEITENPQSFHFNPQTFFREGKSYGWMEKLTEEQIHTIDQKTALTWGEDHLSSPQLVGVRTLEPNEYVLS